MPQKSGFFTDHCRLYERLIDKFSIEEMRKEQNAKASSILIWFWRALLVLMIGLWLWISQKMSQPVSRVLFCKAVATIPLDQQSLAGSSNQPALGPDQTIESLFDLAPGGVYLAFFITKKAVSSYLTISPLP